MKILIWARLPPRRDRLERVHESLARAWSRLGHEVVVFAQEPHPSGSIWAAPLSVRPEGRMLPVFVLDRYEGLDAAATACSRLPSATSGSSGTPPPCGSTLPANLLLVNHVLLGAPVGAATGAPFTVKAHGSELELAIRGNEELAAGAGRLFAGADDVLAGSEHIRRAPGGGRRPGRVPGPGASRPAGSRHRRAGRSRAPRRSQGSSRRPRRDPPRVGERYPDPGNAERLEAFLAGGPTVVYVGKLSDEKGVALLLDAPGAAEACAVVVGFRSERADLEAAAAGRPVLFTGLFEHRHLAHLWALADVSVTPSIFPEAFGMVAAEAAACGSPPLVARHSGSPRSPKGSEAEYPAASRARLVRERRRRRPGRQALGHPRFLLADGVLGPPRGARQSRSGAGTA